MTALPGPRPQFLRYVPRPANVGNRELAQARPVFINDLPVPEIPEDISALGVTWQNPGLDAGQSGPFSQDVQAALSEIYNRLRGLETP